MFRGKTIQKIALLTTILTYVFILLLNPQLGPSDEYAFLPTLQSGNFFPMYGEDFPYYNSVELGRFSPLAGQEYNLVALFSHSPVWYFTLNAIELVIVTFFFIWILNKFTVTPNLIYWVVLVVLFLPGTTLSFFKLLVIEKILLFLFSIFLFSFVSYTEKKNPFFFLLSLTSANLAIYHKETAFIAIGAFAMTHLWFSRKVGKNGTTSLSISLILSSFLYICLYGFLIWPNRGTTYGSNPIDHSMLIALKNISNYAVSSDPILFFLVLPLSTWRFISIFFKKHPPHDILDPMLAAATVYSMAYIILNMYSPYYLLPAYAFAFPPLIYFLLKDKPLHLFWKRAVAVTAFFLVTNSLPLGLHYLTYNKYLPVNFQNTMNFLVKEVTKNFQNQRISIFFDGVDRGTGRGVYFIVGEYLKFKGLSIRQFDLKSNKEARDPSPFLGRQSPFDNPEDLALIDPNRTLPQPNFPFTVFQGGALPDIHSGDYLVASPQATIRMGSTRINHLKNDFDLLFSTTSPFAVPPFTLKTGLKMTLSWLLPQEYKKSFIVNENVFSYPNYYVFKKRSGINPFKKQNGANP